MFNNFCGKADAGFVADLVVPRRAVSLRTQKKHLALALRSAAAVRIFATTRCYKICPGLSEGSDLT